MEHRAALLALRDPVTERVDDVVAATNLADESFAGAQQAAVDMVRAELRRPLKQPQQLPVANLLEVTDRVQVRFLVEVIPSSQECPESLEGLLESCVVLCKISQQ